MYTPRSPLCSVYMPRRRRKCTRRLVFQAFRTLGGADGQGQASGAAAFGDRRAWQPLRNPFMGCGTSSATASRPNTAQKGDDEGVNDEDPSSAAEVRRLHEATPASLLEKLTHVFVDFRTSRSKMRQHRPPQYSMMCVVLCRHTDTLCSVE